jgi:hypothetical protein
MYLEPWLPRERLDWGGRWPSSSWSRLHRYRTSVVFPDPFGPVMRT